MTHELYEVFKNESFNGVKFGVQLPKGILGFKTKKQAQYVAQELKKSFLPETAIEPPAESSKMFINGRWQTF